MNKIVRFLFFCLFFFAGFLLLAGMFFYAGQRATSKLDLYRVSADKNIFIFGHSRTAYAFNDTLIKGARNFANTAEPYFFTAAKVKQLLLANPNVKTVVVELSEIHMNQQQTDEWTFSSAFLSHHLPNYGSIVDIQKHWRLIQNNTKAYFRLLPIISRQNLPFIVKPKSNFFSSRNFGGYLVHDSSLIGNRLLLNHESKKKEESSISNDLQYLDEIVTYCNERYVQLIFLRSPTHPAFNINGHDSLWHSVYTSKYNKYSVIDLTEYPLPDSAYYDYHHLNKYGANIISQKLDSALQKLSKQNQ